MYLLVTFRKGVSSMHWRERLESLRNRHGSFSSGYVRLAATIYIF